MFGRESTDIAFGVGSFFNAIAIESSQFFPIPDPRSPSVRWVMKAGSIVVERK